MADIRLIALTTVYIIWWPINQLLKAAVVVITPVWNFLSFILLPFIHLAQTIFNIVTFPFAGKWLDRIEVHTNATRCKLRILKQIQTLYIYLGTAGLIGCMTGAVVYVLFKALSSSLNLDSAPRKPGRTVAEFRVEQRSKGHRVKKEKSPDVTPTPTPVILKRVPGPRRQGLLSQAIIEEEDSDF